MFKLVIMYYAHMRMHLGDSEHERMNGEYKTSI